MTRAEDLLDAAVREQQVACKLAPGDDATALREQVRRLARARGVHIRTGLLDGDVVAVVLADADVWHEDQATMRRKLTPPS